MATKQVTIMRSGVMIAVAIYDPALPANDQFIYRAVFSTSMEDQIAAAGWILRRLELPLPPKVKWEDWGLRIDGDNVQYGDSE